MGFQGSVQELQLCPSVCYRVGSLETLYSVIVFDVRIVFIRALSGVCRVEALDEGLIRVFWECS